MSTVMGSVVRRLAASYPGRLLQVYLASQAGNYAPGLAFTAFLSMFPLIVGLLAILGLITHDPSTRAQFLSGALTFFPADSQEPLTGALDAVRHNAGIFGVIGIVGMFWSGSSLFTMMEYTLGRMFGARQRDFLRQRAMALVMTIAFAVSVVATIGLNASLSLLGSVPHLQPVAGLVVWLLFMIAVYRIVPNRTYPVRRTLPGVALAAVLTEALSLLWPLFTKLTHGFNTYGSAFALFFLLATWQFFIATFILLGAVAIRMRAGAPTVAGMIGAAEREPLITEGTEAAERLGRRPAGRRQAAGRAQ